MAKNDNEKDYLLQDCYANSLYHFKPKTKRQILDYDDLPGETRQEKMIWVLNILKWSNRNIAKLLKISPRTVQRIKKKMFVIPQKRRKSK